MTAGADGLIATLGLEPHPEGGWYRRVWTHPERDEHGRARASAIDYLLTNEQHSEWHRLDATEVWIWRAGGPLVLRMVAGEQPHVAVLGPDRDHHVLEAVVEPEVWQSAALLAGAPWCLVSCLVVPEFSWDGFERAGSSVHWG